MTENVFKTAPECSQGTSLQGQIGTSPVRQMGLSPGCQVGTFGDVGGGRHRDVLGPIFVGWEQCSLLFLLLEGNILCFLFCLYYFQTLTQKFYSLPGNPD